MRFRNRLDHIGESMAGKRRDVQKKYRDKKRMRLDKKFRGACSYDETLASGHKDQEYSLF